MDEFNTTDELNINEESIKKIIKELDKEIKNFNDTYDYKLDTPTNQSRWSYNHTPAEIEENIRIVFKPISDRYKILDSLVFRTMEENRLDVDVFSESLYELKRLAKDINNIIINYDFLQVEKIDLNYVYQMINAAEQLRKGGGKKSKKQPKKEILGVMRCIYKIPGDRKEYVKHKGKLITIKDFKEFMKPKKQDKPKKLTKPKKQTKAKKQTKTK